MNCEPLIRADVVRAVRKGYYMFVNGNYIDIIVEPVIVSIWP